MDRQIYVLALTTVVMSCYLGSVVRQDTLSKSADRLAKAIVQGDTTTIWTFVPEDERKYYSLNQGKFAAYWEKIVQPHLKGVVTYEFSVAGTNGLEVVLKSSEPLNKQKLFSLLVSGQKGQYYVPYIIATSGLHAAAANIALKNLTTFQRFDHYAEWIKGSKQDLISLGFQRIRRGPLFPGETPDEMEHHFREIADEDFARAEVTELVRLAQR